MTNREAFAITLPKYMERAKMNQTDLANAVGVSKATVHCWVKGIAFPRVDVMQRVADVLGCETDDLTYVAKMHFAGSDSQQILPEVLMMLENRINAVNEDKELRMLWEKASPAAKKAALAVLRSMQETGG